MGGIIVPSGREGSLAGEVLGFQFAGPAVDFNPAEGEDDAPFFRGEDGRRVGVFGLLGVTRVCRWSGNAGLVTLKSEGCLVLADDAGRLAVDASVLESLAKVNRDVLFGVGRRGEAEVGKGHLSEVDEEGVLIESGDFLGSLIHEVGGCRLEDRDRKEEGEEKLHGCKDWFFSGAYQTRELVRGASRRLKDTGRTAQTIGRTRLASHTTAKPTTPIKDSITEKVLRVSVSFIPDILETIQKPLSFIQGRGFEPQPIARAT